MTSKIRRTIALVSTIVMMLALSAPGVSAQVAWEDADFNAFATGTNVHGFVAEQPDNGTSTRLLDASVGFTGAATDSEGLAGPRDNDMDLRVHPDIPDQHSYARASAIEGGGGVVVPDGPAEGTEFYGWSPLEDEESGTLADGDGPMDASAPPTEHHANEAADIDLEEAAHAQLLYGEVFADWDDEACVPFLSEGFAQADDVRLLDAAGAEEELTEEQWIAQTQELESYSGTYLGPQVDEDGDRLGDHAGVYAETRQTTASVTFFEGQDIEFTVTIDGPQVLRAVATGIEGGAYIEYEAPLVTVTQPEEEHLNIDVAGEGGTVRLPPEGEGEGQLLAEISIFDEPYEEEVADDGTYAAAEVDLVSVALLGEEELGQAAEFRIGHMEVESEAPEGGIICEIPMEKTVEPQEVTAGDDFTFTIEIENPYDHCDVTARVVDEISVEEGDPSWTVTGTDPEADEVSDDRIVWEDVTIAAGETAEFTIFVTADEDSEDGVLRNDAWLEDALCEGMPLHGDAEVVAGMPVVGAAFVIGPGISAPAAEPAVLPTTGGGNAAALIGLLLAAGALLLRSRRGQVAIDDES